MDNDHGTQVDQVEIQGSDEASDREKYVTLECICELGWEAHRAWERIIGEQPKLPWSELSADRQEEIKHSVVYITDHPHATVSMQHDYWRAIQASKPNARDKNMIPFEKLPWSQQQKARLWRHIVHSIVG